MFGSGTGGPPEKRAVDEQAVTSPGLVAGKMKQTWRRAT